MKKTIDKVVTAGLVLILCISVLSIYGCDSGKNTGPKTMPTPKEGVGTLPTAGPTITPSDTNNDNENPDDTLGDDQGADPEEDKPQNKVVVLDPGHGGKFTGARYFDFKEEILTLSVANYVRDYLLTNYEGIEVYLTREENIALDDDIKLELEKRAIVAEEHNADFFVSLHFNASENHQLNGTTVYASFRENVSEKSQGMAYSILDQLVALGLKNNGVKTRVSKDYVDAEGNKLDYYAVIRHAQLRDIPGVIVEHCFMDNETDKEFFDTEEKLRMLAEADAKGIANYMELKKK